jgi:hypothetical protein
VAAQPERIGHILADQVIDDDHLGAVEHVLGHWVFLHRRHCLRTGECGCIRVIE